MRNFILMPLGSNRIDRTGCAGQWWYTYVFGSLGGRISDVCILLSVADCGFAVFFNSEMLIKLQIK